MKKPIRIDPSWLEDQATREEALGIAEDRFMSRKKHRDKWFTALQTCDKAILECGDGAASLFYFYTFMMPDYPIVVGMYSPGPATDVYHSLYYTVDWDRIDTIVLPINASPTVQLQNYFLQAYGFNTAQKEFSNGIPFIPAYGATLLNLTTAQVYELVKEYYVSFDDPDKVGSSYLAAFNKSEDSWPQLEGMHTDYIANLGVFVPNDYNVNPVLTDLVKPHIGAAFQEWVNSFVVLDKKTFGSLEGIGAADALEAWDPIIDSAGMIPFAGPIIGVAGNAAQGAWRAQNITQNRMFWPRLYAFGRNKDMPILDYSTLCAIRNEYDRSANVSGARAPIIDPPRSDLYYDIINKLKQADYI